MPTLLERARTLLVARCDGILSSRDWLEPVVVNPLSAFQALGNPTPKGEFPLEKGEEKLIEAAYRTSRGQAFTRFPTSWKGPLEKALFLPLSDDRNRAVSLAAMNALGREVGIADRTVHCRDEGPRRCAASMGKKIEEKLTSEGVLGIVGYQPALLEEISSRLGAERVRLVDLSFERIGKRFHGVLVLDGEREFERFLSEIDLALVTGSTLANGSVDAIVEALSEKGIPILFYGTTCAVTAALLGWERYCFEAE